MPALAGCGAGTPERWNSMSGHVWGTEHERVDQEDCSHTEAWKRLRILGFIMQGLGFQAAKAEHMWNIS